MIFLSFHMHGGVVLLDVLVSNFFGRDCSLLSVIGFFWEVIHRGGGWSLNFFQVGVRSLDFWSVGLVNWSLFTERGSFELKIPKFGGLRMTRYANIEVAVAEAKISYFFPQGGACELTILWNRTLVNYGLLKWDPCELWERRQKGVFRAAHLHTRSAPLPPSLSW